MDQDGSNTKKIKDFKGNDDMQSDSQKIVSMKCKTGPNSDETSLFRWRKYESEQKSAGLKNSSKSCALNMFYIL